MKFGISITIIFILLIFLIGCGGSDPNARTVKLEVTKVEGWPAGDKLCAVLYKDSSKINRMRKDINVPGTGEFKVTCDRNDKIWIECTDTKSLASVDMTEFGKSLTVYLDGEKVAYGPLPEKGKFSLCFEIKVK